MKEIKNFIRRTGITQKELADIIGLSRPTLDTYIEYYENGMSIPKERYQEIFDYLFQNLNSGDDFVQRLEKFWIYENKKYDFHQERYQKDSLLNETILNLKKMDHGTEDECNLLKFINLLITNIDNEIFQYIIRYFLIINGIIDYKEISQKDIPYMANIYNGFRSVINQKDSYKKEDFTEFINRCDEIEKYKKNRRENIVRNYYEKQIAKIELLENMGINLSDDEIVKLIKEIR